MSFQIGHTCLTMARQLRAETRTARRGKPHTSFQIKEVHIMEAQVTITLTQEEVSLLHTALCDYRGKIGNLAAQIASASLDSTEADELWNRLGSLSRRLAAQIHD